jgi:hypothetical protein
MKTMTLLTRSNTKRAGQFIAKLIETRSQATDLPLPIVNIASKPIIQRIHVTHHFPLLIQGSILCMPIFLHRN